MKPLDELISRLNDIQELPISEEILGAYVEGILQGTELDTVMEQISSDTSLEEILNDIAETDTENSAEASHPWNLYDGDYGYWELGLPPILPTSGIIPEDDKEKIDDFSIESDRIQAEETLSLQNAENSIGNNLLNSNVRRGGHLG